MFENKELIDRRYSALTRQKKKGQNLLSYTACVLYFESNELLDELKKKNVSSLLYTPYNLKTPNLLRCSSENYLGFFFESQLNYIDVAVKLKINVIFSSDINECKYNKGGCSHECVNDDGGHHCACPDPLVLSDDKRNCRGL